MSENHTSSKRPADLPAGYDENDPYEGVDLDAFPRWWRDNIEEFQRYNMRPYRPPRFNDGTVVPALVNELSDELDVAIRIRNIDPQERTGEDTDEQQDWDVVVDEQPISTVPRHRAPEGYTVYDISADEFERMVRASV